MRPKPMFLALCAIFCAALVFVLQGCEFATGGGGTGGDGLTLTGIIVNPRGAPVAGAKVRIYPEQYQLAKRATSSPAKADSVLTDSVGAYRFVNLPSGRYNLEASARIGDSAFSLFVPGIYLGKNLNLGADTIRTTGSLEVTVLDNAGAHLPGAHCYVVGGSWEAVSDDSGTCALTGLAPGRYKILITSPGLQSETVETITVYSGNVAQGGSVRLSPAAAGSDTTWTVRYRVEGETVSALAWSGSATGSGGGMLVAIGSGRDVYGEPYNFILSSPDGLTWTKRDYGAASQLHDVAWIPPNGSRAGEFLAVGEGGLILTSPDGITWATKLSVAWALGSITVNARHVLFTGSSHSVVLTDGVTWTDVTRTGSPNSIAATDSLFVEVGFSNTVQSSPDGIIWTKRDAQTTNVLYKVAWGGGQFVAVGANGTIRTSVDGIQWEKRVSGTTETLSTLEWVNGRWIAGGDLESTDGILWQPMAHPVYQTSIVSTGTRLVGILNGIMTSP